ncbi:hypothetical protein [Hyphomonas sp.]|uniref:hypothetical protein n=1 Tax=Hyphomonas sp. TaxID=87 RepID=UPI0039199E20
MKRALVLLALLLASSCTQPLPEPAPPPAPAEAVTVTASSIEGLSGQIPFTLPSIERAFPGFTIVADEEDGVPIFSVREPGSDADLFRLRPDWSRGFIGSVTVLVPGDTGLVELQPNVSPFTDLPAEIAQACNPEPAPTDGPFSCTVALSTGELILAFPSARYAPRLESARYVPGPTPR